jgi:YidC/Oxa1 family membrane protein insertase
MMLILPIVFVFILYRYPAGLLVYWITTNLWTIGQQFIIRRHMGPSPAPPGAGLGGGDDGDSPNGKPDSSRGRGARAEPALAGAVPGGSSSPPPRSPRKKKKRSGRRR